MQGLQKSIQNLATLLLITTASCMVHADNLPDLGSEVNAELSQKEEKIIGQAFLHQLHAAELIAYDPLVTDYIIYLGNTLASAAATKDPFTFFVIRDDTINAFAFFGANVAINQGLIAATETESQLAAVIAHEMAHVSQHHLHRSIAANRKILPLSILGAVGAAVLGAGELAIAALATHQQHMINFTRAHEKEADRMGLQLLTKAGFDPQGMPQVFQLMDKLSRYQHKQIEYLSTHPLYESRIADAYNRAKHLPYKQSANNERYPFIKARIEVVTTTDLHTLLSRYQHAIKTASLQSNPALYYGYSLALLQDQQIDKAVSVMERLLVAQPDNFLFKFGLAEIKIAAHKNSEAIQIMQKLYKIYPDDSALMLQYSGALLNNNQLNLAKKVINKHITLYPDMPIAYKLLAQTESMQNNYIGMHQATSTWHILHGNFDGAIQQLNFALEYAKKQKIINKLQAEKQSINSMKKEFRRF